MADLERMATSASAGITRTVHRLGKLAASIIAVTALVGLATFLTGWWVFDGSLTWVILGGALSLVPVAAACTAWFLVFRTVRLVPRLAGDLRSYLATPSTASGVLLDHDSGVTLGSQAKSFSTLRADLIARRHELPALYHGVRAITSVPGLAAIALLGLLAVGALGSALLLAGVID